MYICIYIYCGTGIAKGGGVFMVSNPKTPNEGACLRFMLKRKRQMRGRVEDI